MQDRNVISVSEITKRLLMGPGPSNVHPRVLKAMSRPTIGHLDPQFMEIIEQISEMLRIVFKTRNKLTLAVSGTGSAGMEAAVANVIEPGDKMLVCIGGVFGMRMKDVAQRYGAKVTDIAIPWGQVFTTQQIQQAISEHGPFKLVGIVHAETSTGAKQPLPDLSKIVHQSGAMLLVDAVTSLGGIEVDVDGWNIDICYSGTQKCLSCPPGLAPITFSATAEEIIQKRKTKVASWYFDMNMIRNYWGTERLYHHTAPINMIYALHEALRMVLEEGLNQRWKRHEQVHHILKKDLEALGLRYLSDPQNTLPMLNAVAVPEGINEAVVRNRLLQEHHIEIGGGLGDYKGKAWRIGIMGHTARVQSVKQFLKALRSVLNHK